MIGIDDDDFGTRWEFKAIAVAGVLVVIAVALNAMGYKFVKPQPSVNWIPQPFTQERNQQGQTVANVYVGLDDKGYLRWTRQEVQQQAAPMPAAQMTPPAPTVVPEPSKNAFVTKPASKHGK